MVNAVAMAVQLLGFIASFFMSPVNGWYECQLMLRFFKAIQIVVLKCILPVLFSKNRFQTLLDEIIQEEERLMEQVSNKPVFWKDDDDTGDRSPGSVLRKDAVLGRC